MSSTLIRHGITVQENQLVPKPPTYDQSMVATGGYTSFFVPFPNWVVYSEIAGVTAEHTASHV